MLNFIATLPINLYYAIAWNACLYYAVLFEPDGLVL